jgi:hypothetical protein
VTRENVLVIAGGITLFCAEDKNETDYTSPPPYTFMMCRETALSLLQINLFITGGNSNIEVSVLTKAEKPMWIAYRVGGGGGSFF